MRERLARLTVLRLASSSSDHPRSVRSCDRRWARRVSISSISNLESQYRDIFPFMRIRQDRKPALHSHRRAGFVH
jgi:hypothetical protein